MDNISAVSDINFGKIKKHNRVLIKIKDKFRDL